MPPPCDGTAMASVGLAVLGTVLFWVIYLLVAIVRRRTVGMMIAGYPRRSSRRGK